MYNKNGWAVRPKSLVVCVQKGFWWWDINIPITSNVILDFNQPFLSWLKSPPKDFSQVLEADDQWWRRVEGPRSWGGISGRLWRPCFEYGPYPTYSNYCPISQVKGNAVQPVEMFQLSTCHTMFSKSCRSQSCTIPRLWRLQPSAGRGQAYRTPSCLACMMDSFHACGM